MADDDGRRGHDRRRARDAVVRPGDLQRLAQHADRAVRTDTELADTREIVTVRALEVAPEMAEARDFVGPKDRFIKRIAATAGDPYDERLLVHHARWDTICRPRV